MKCLQSILLTTILGFAMTSLLSLREMSTVTKTSDAKIQDSKTFNTKCNAVSPKDARSCFDVVYRDDSLACCFSKDKKTAKAICFSTTRDNVSNAENSKTADVDCPNPPKIEALPDKNDDDDDDKKVEKNDNDDKKTPSPAPSASSPSPAASPTASDNITSSSSIIKVSLLVFALVFFL